MFSDRRILFGIGIGILLSIIFTLPIKLDYGLSDGEIEIRAKSLGMRYPEEVKLDIREDISND